MFDKTIKNKILKNQIVNILLILTLLSLFFVYLKLTNPIAYLGLSLFIGYSFLIVILIKLLYDSYKLNSIKLSFINSVLSDIYIVTIIFFIEILLKNITVGEALQLTYKLIMFPIILSIIISIVPFITSRINLLMNNIVKPVYRKKK